jgi:hypothetical protein
MRTASTMAPNMTAALSPKRAIGLKLGARAWPGKGSTVRMWKTSSFLHDNFHTSNTRHSGSDFAEMLVGQLLLYLLAPCEQSSVSLKALTVLVRTINLKIHVRRPLTDAQVSSIDNRRTRTGDYPAMAVTRA